MKYWTFTSMFLMRNALKKGNAKLKTSEIEKKKKTTEDSLPLRINTLNDKVAQLKEEITMSEQKLEKDKIKLSEMKTELTEVETKLS